MRVSLFTGARGVDEGDRGDEARDTSTESNFAPSIRVRHVTVSPADRADERSEVINRGRQVTGNLFHLPLRATAHRFARSFPIITRCAVCLCGARALLPIRPARPSHALHAVARSRPPSRRATGKTLWRERERKRRDTLDRGSTDLTRAVIRSGAVSARQTRGKRQRRQRGRGGGGGAGTWRGVRLAA